jgi:hypothetical protein
MFASVQQFVLLVMCYELKWLHCIEWQEIILYPEFGREWSLPVSG